MRSVQSLTTTQALIYKLDQEGYRPSKIAELTGMGTSRIGNIKQRLREMGFPVTKFKEHGDRTVKVKEMDPVKESSVPVMRSEFEPEDDELPDLDEPVIEVKRCHCGLILPCYHEPVSVWKSGPGRDDNLQDMRGVGDCRKLMAKTKAKHGI